MATQATGLEKEQQSNRVLNTPLDKFIVRIASTIGGSKAKEVERFMKFAFVGIIGASIDMGVLTLLTSTILPVDANGINKYIAASISFVCAVLSNFTWNRYWTYPDSRSRPILRQLGQFALVSLTGWTGRLIWIALVTAPFTRLVGYINTQASLGFDNSLVAQLGVLFAVFIGIFVIMIWNFLVNRFWTYNDVD